MAKNYNTILFFPSKTAGVKKFRLSQFTIKCIFFSITMVMIALGFMVYDYANIKFERLELENLKEGTRRQKIHIQSFANKINSLESQIARLKQFDRKLRVIANLEKPGQGDQTLGIGGSLNEGHNSSLIFDGKQDMLIKRMHSDLEQLKIDASLQEHSLQERFSRSYGQ